MAQRRAVVAGLALVLCAAVLVAAVHAGRVIEYQALEAGIEAAEPALAPLAAADDAAVSPAASADDDVAAADADAGGVVRTLGVVDEARERASMIGDIVWMALQWANQAAFGGGERRKAY